MIPALLRKLSAVALVPLTIWLLFRAATGTSAPSSTLTPIVTGGTRQPAYLPLLLQAPPTVTPSPTATLLPTATSTPTRPASAWLQYVNEFRAAAKLPNLTENSAWSSGDWLHSRYMVKEDHISHRENASSPWYTAEGDIAGRNGNIFVSGWTNAVDEYAIDFWMAGPFHAVAILDPQLHETAFASYREPIGYWHMGATLDWGRGLGALPSNTTFPIFFPSDGGETWITQHPGYEWPDPLSNCPGYVAPTGPPLIVQLGSGSLTPQVTAHSFTTSSGNNLAHCIFDETTYTNPSSSSQYSGRAVLNSRDAVVLMPREPLRRGETYIASITANGTTYTWSFSVVIPPRTPYQVPEGMDYVIMR